MEIYLIRHGKTLYNSEGRFIGSTDLPLTDIGRKEIEGLWCEKAPLVDVLYSSPLKRCIETAEIIFPLIKPKIITNLREMCFGIFEGHKEESLKDRPEYNEFIKNMATYQIPQGEGGVGFMKRVKNGFLDVIADMNLNHFNRSAVVAHGGVIMALLALFCEESKELMHYWLSNGGYYLINFDIASEKIIIKDRRCE